MGIIQLKKEKKNKLCAFCFVSTFNPRDGASLPFMCKVQLCICYFIVTSANLHSQALPNAHVIGEGRNLPPVNQNIDVLFSNPPTHPPKEKMLLCFKILFAFSYINCFFGSLSLQ